MEVRSFVPLYSGPTKATSFEGFDTEGFAHDHQSVFHGGGGEAVGWLATLGNLGIVAIGVQDIPGTVLDPDFELGIRDGDEALNGDVFVGRPSGDILYFVTLVVVIIFVLVKDALDYV